MTLRDAFECMLAIQGRSLSRGPITQRTVVVFFVGPKGSLGSRGHVGLPGSPGKLLHCHFLVTFDSLRCMQAVKATKEIEESSALKV